MFETQWDIANPPKILGVWDPDGLDPANPSTFPVLKLLDGPIIEKLVYEITDLFFNVEED